MKDKDIWWHTSSIMEHCVWTKHNRERLKDCILLLKKVTSESLRTTVIILTAIAGKVFNALLLNHMQPEVEKIFRKNQNGFWENQFTTSWILFVESLKAYMQKILK